MYNKLKLNLLKYLITSKNKGFILPTAIGAGLILTIIGVTLIIRSHKDLIISTSSRLETNSQGTAETGISIIRSQLRQIGNSPYFTQNYDELNLNTGVVYLGTDGNPETLGDNENALVHEWTRIQTNEYHICTPTEDTDGIANNGIGRETARNGLPSSRSIIGDTDNDNSDDFNDISGARFIDASISPEFSSSINASTNVNIDTGNIPDAFYIIRGYRYVPDITPNQGTGYLLVEARRGSTDNDNSRSLILASLQIQQEIQFPAVYIISSTNNDTGINGLAANNIQLNSNNSNVDSNNLKVYCQDCLVNRTTTTDTPTTLHCENGDIREINKRAGIGQTENTLPDEDDIYIGQLILPNLPRITGVCSGNDTVNCLLDFDTNNNRNINNLTNNNRLNRLDNNDENGDDEIIIFPLQQDVDRRNAAGDPSNLPYYYEVSDINLNSDVTIRIDTTDAPVILQVNGNITLNGGAKFEHSNTTNNNLFVILGAADNNDNTTAQTLEIENLNSEGLNDIEVFIYAPDADVRLGANITGGIWARELTFQDDMVTTTVTSPTTPDATVINITGDNLSDELGALFNDTNFTNEGLTLNINNAITEWKRIQVD